MEIHFDLVPILITYTTVVIWLARLEFMTKKHSKEMDTFNASRIVLLAEISEISTIHRREIDMLKEKTNDLSKELNQKLSDIREILGRMEERINKDN